MEAINVTRAELREIEGKTLKVYFFNTAMPFYEKGVANLVEGLPKCITSNLGNIGVAFVYAYPDKAGSMVLGADVMLYREPGEPNTMIDPITIENGVQIRTGFCNEEALVMGKESAIRKEMRGSMSKYLETPVEKTPFVDLRRKEGAMKAVRT